MAYPTLKDDELSLYKRRILRAIVIFILISVILFIKLYVMQVVHYETFLNSATKNRFRERDVASNRGLIYDRKMSVLVSNTPTYDLIFEKEHMIGKLDIDSILNDINGITPIDIKKIKEDLKNNRVASVMIKRGLSIQDIAYFEEYSDDFAGMSIKLSSTRKYPNSTSFSHILGYINEVDENDIKANPTIYKLGSQIGITGLEVKYENILRGESGSQIIERNALGKIVSITPNVAPINGNDLILSIDKDIQEYAAKTMGDKKGAIIVMDIDDFSLLTLFSAPTFDLNYFTPFVNRIEWNKLFKNERKPLINRTIEGVYSPGSIYKIPMAMMGLEEGAVDTNTSFVCNGEYILNSYFTYGCWKKHGHGRIKLKRAIAESCDVYFYNLGLALGIAKMEYYSTILSLGVPTGIDLPNEKSGTYPTRDWKRKIHKTEWYQGDTINTSIGQGFLTATPLQAAVMIGSIFNGGKIYKPHVVKSVLDNKNKRTIDTEPELIHQISISKNTISQILEGMYEAVYTFGGTARRAALKEVKVAGKTGTAQVASMKITKAYEEKNLEVPEKYRDHAWFTGVFPAEKPKYVIVVLAENAGGGGAVAAPIAAEVIKKVVEQGYIEK